MKLLFPHQSGLHETLSGRPYSGSVHFASAKRAPKSSLPIFCAIYAGKNSRILSFLTDSAPFPFTLTHYRGEKP